MNNAVKVVMNWSSGKDAALAYQYLTTMPEIAEGALLTTLSAEHDRIFMHGVREELLDMQAARMGQKLIKVKLPASPDDGLYRHAMQTTMNDLKEQGFTTAAFGDIFLDDLKTCRERQLREVGIDTLFPLWKKDTGALVHEVERAGIEAVVVCVSDRHLGKEFLGRKIDASFLNDLPQGVDPCGENGEFHTFVSNAPFFSSPVPVVFGDTVYRSYKDPGEGGGMAGFYFLDLHV